MKKLVIFLVLVGAISNWKTVADILGIQYGPVKYTVGNYSSNKWHWGGLGYSQAVQLSEQHKTPMLIYVYADWCGYCKEFQSTLLSNRNVKSTLSNFVKVKLNPEKSSEEKALYKKWGGKGYPAILLQSGNNAPTRIMAPYYRQGSGWKIMTSTQFINILNKHST